jgi:hypothetical protein
MAINNIADLFVATLEQAGMSCATATGNRRPDGYLGALAARTQQPKKIPRLSPKPPPDRSGRHR